MRSDPNEDTQMSMVSVTSKNLPTKFVSKMTEERLEHEHEGGTDVGAVLIGR